jgi:hypothetical protein
MACRRGTFSHLSTLVTQLLVYSPSNFRLHINQSSAIGTPPASEGAKMPLAMELLSGRGKVNQECNRVFNLILAMPRS